MYLFVGQRLIIDSADSSVSTPYQVTSHIEIKKIANHDIISFIEHPTDSTKIIAAASKQLVEINHHGDCTVVAGVQLQGCAYLENAYTFTSISHIISANLSKLNLLRSHKKQFIFVADQPQHCIKVVTLDDLLNVNYAMIGQCGEAGTLVVYQTYSRISDVRLDSPTHLAILYFADVTRLIINCVKNNNTYSIILNIYTSYFIIHSYYGFQFGFVTGFANNFYYPTAHSFGVVSPTNEITTCEAKSLVQENTNTVSFECSNNCIPVIVDGQQLFVNNEKLKRFKVSSGHVELVDVVVTGLNTNLDFISAVSTEHNFIVYSKTSQTFYYVGHPKHKRFLALSERMCSSKSVRVFKQLSIESCAYACGEQYENCVAFSITSKAKCYIHNEVSVAFEHSLSSTCYVLG